MALDFPANPTTGATYSAAGLTWAWDGTKWESVGTAGGGGGGASVSVGATPPASPIVGDLWWDTVSGNLYCYYNDGDSSQWVIANSGVEGPQGPAGAASNVTVSDTAPASPYAGDLWFDSVGCQTYIFYNDGNSAQWVPTNNQLGSTVVTSGTPPPNPQNGNLWWDSVGGQLYVYFNDGTSSQWIATSPTGQSQGQIGGYLSVVGTSPSNQLQFVPLNGNQIQINGLRYTIPNSGIVGLTNTNCYVEGVAGQSLVASTVYRVYCFNNAGTLTADFSQTAHATSTTPGNSGVEIRSGDDTRTLIGLVIPGGGAQFYDTPQYRYVRSWVNRKRISISPAEAVSTMASTSLVTVAQAGVVCFNDEALVITVICSGYLSLANTTANCALMLDGSQVGVGTSYSAANANYWLALGSSYTMQSTEGSHTIGVALSVSTGGSTPTLTYYAGVVGTIG